MAKTAEKKIALELYLSTQLSQKEIAERVGVTEHTLSKWAALGGWRELKLARSITRDELLKDAYSRLEKINMRIDRDFEGLPDKKTNDAKSTILREIQTLEKDDSLAMTVSVMEKFTRFVSQRDLSLAKALGPISVEFLESRAHES